MVRRVYRFVSLGSRGFVVSEGVKSGKYVYRILQSKLKAEHHLGLAKVSDIIK